MNEDRSSTPRLTGAGLTAPALAGATLLLVVGFGVWLRLSGDHPLGIDTWWHTLAGVEPGTPAFSIALLLHRLGGTVGVAVCVTIATALLVLRRRPRDAGLLLTAALIGVSGSELLKYFVARPRPLDALVTETNFSYPSGHSMGAAMLAVSIALICVSSTAVSSTAASSTAPGTAAARRAPGRAAARVVWVAAVLWILAMMWSRTALQVHWLTDTVAGAALGAGAAVLAWRVWARGQGTGAAVVEPAAGPQPATSAGSSCP